MGIAWWGLCIWGQLSLWTEGAIGVIHRVPVARPLTWEATFAAKRGEARMPGPYGWGGLSLRYASGPKTFLEVGLGLRGFVLWANGLQETHLQVNFPLRGGVRLKDIDRPWWLWVGLSSSVQLAAHSSPRVGGVYRFADYFARSQLHLQTGLERTFSARWQGGLGAGWDISSAWDRGLFRAYRSLAHHLWVYPYLRYRLWAEHG
ncbi:MAG: hypothetical protein KatS3mg026_1473 [Bacteroidia bacterium]|nr:MAG: hypothetical protein KatS3mg026_1473 [Bacteroidia bacterium]